MTGEQANGKGGDILADNPHLRGNPRAMAMMCAALRRMQREPDALAMGLAAIAAAPESMEVRNIVRWAMSQGVARFHGPMLADTARHEAYIRAIERAVGPGMLVLEIGAGSGLLAMAAARAGATVVACERDPAIAAVATEIVARNGLADRVRIVAKQSNRLEIGVDLAAPADLVIHEIFGEYLFNELVDAAMADARARLLAPTALAVPPRAEVRCALATLTKPASDPIGLVAGFDLSPFNLLIKPAPRNVVAGRDTFALCSERYSGLAMDYGGPAPFGPRRQTIEVESHGGRVDGVVQWIRIDFGEGEVLESDPTFPPPQSSWIAPIFEFVTPIETLPGDIIDVALFHDGSNLSIDAVART